MDIYSIAGQPVQKDIYSSIAGQRTTWMCQRISYPIVWRESISQLKQRIKDIKLKQSLRTIIK
jgi:hypothetical protein